LREYNRRRQDFPFSPIQPQNVIAYLLFAPPLHCRLLAYRWAHFSFPPFFSPLDAFKGMGSHKPPDSFSLSFPPHSCFPQHHSMGKPESPSPYPLCLRMTGAQTQLLVLTRMIWLDFPGLVTSPSRGFNPFPNPSSPPPPQNSQKMRKAVVQFNGPAKFPSFSRSLPPLLPDSGANPSLFFTITFPFLHVFLLSPWNAITFSPS